MKKINLNKLAAKLNFMNFSNDKLRNSLIVAYILIILGVSATSRAQVSILPYPQPGNVQVVEFEGYVAATLDGSYYLIISEEEFFEIASENIDL